MFKTEHQGVYLLYLMYEMIEDFNDIDKTIGSIEFLLRIIIII